MTTLSDQLASQEAAAADQAQAERADAHRRYIEIVARADKPQAGDAAALSELFQTLGKDRRVFDEDVSNWGKLQRAEARIEGIPAAREAAERAEKAYRQAKAALPDKVKELEAEVRGLHDAMGRAFGRQERADRSVREAADFRRRLGMTS